MSDEGNEERSTDMIRWWIWGYGGGHGKEGTYEKEPYGEDVSRGIGLSGKVGYRGRYGR